MKLQSKQVNIWLFSRAILAFILLTALAQWSVMPAKAAVKIDIPGPAGSGAFGEEVAVLPNGNFVVVDTEYDGGIGVDAGAVYL